VTVWDVFPFWNEVELLQLRVDLLAEAPDEVRHVAAEGTHTYQGHPKPSCLTERAADLNLPVTFAAVTVPLADGGPWDREARQRDGLVDVVREVADPDDLVLSCDLDELVDPGLLDHLYRMTDAGPVRLGLQLFYYGLTWQDPDPWRHPLAFRARDLDGPLGGGLSAPRTGLKTWDVVPDAGWHVSYWGGPDRRRRKIEAYAHTEVLTDANMRRRVEAGGAADPHGKRLVPARLDRVHPLVLERLR